MLSNPHLFLCIMGAAERLFSFLQLIDIMNLLRQDAGGRDWIYFVQNTKRDWQSAMTRKALS